MAHDDLSRWCELDPNLLQTDENAWAIKSTEPVSYPTDGLSELAELEEYSYWFNHRNAIIGSVVARFRPSGTIFDIGGGNGYVSLGLVSSGYPSVVVEPDLSGIAVASARGLPTIRAGLSDLELPDNSVPAFGMFDVLEHIEAEREVLSRLVGALQPGGMAYISVPALSWLWSSEDEEAGHFRRYTRKSLAAVMRGSGLEPLYSSYFFRALVPAVFAVRTMPSLLRLPVRKVDRTGEHTLPANLVGRQITRSFQEELARLAGGQTVAIGTSVIAVGRKI